MYFFKRQVLIIQALLVLLSMLLTCTSYQNDYLIAFNDAPGAKSGYLNQNGDTVIRAGKYLFCFTDTFRNFAVVHQKKNSFVAINRKEEVLYQVLPYDNGPDYAAGGLFRITINHKIGYADEVTGEIRIKPQFSCAFPFEEGRAKVSEDCITKTEGEHQIWQSNHWFYIDKHGKKLNK